MKLKSPRHLVVVLGDQLDPHSSAFEGFKPELDAVWMAEVVGEATAVWSSKPRIAFFLAAMRHHREAQRALGRTVHYAELGETGLGATLGSALQESLARLKPQKVIWVEAGEHRVEVALEEAARLAGVPSESRTDTHFLCSRREFEDHARGRKQLRLEFFYREMRRRHRILLTKAGEPEGGEWNFDADNRGTFGKEGPKNVPAPRAFAPDALTRRVIAEVEQRFAEHPGKLQEFDWPVTAEQAREAWNDFVAHRLPHFGRYQDAMWTDEPWLYHARIAAAMNVKLLAPLEMIRDVENAYRKGRVELAAAEGFIRQVLGWREYVRGIYWRYMPDYLERNALGAKEPLPPFFWTGKTSCNCLRQCIGQTLELGYAHHIQRLMVTGLFCLLVGVDPKEVHRWYLAVYVDAVEWVELPNSLGMSQYADGGIMASKPYIATGKYIQRMSNYCQGCVYDPASATSERACPFTTLYWDFLLTHEKDLRGNPRMALQARNVDRLEPEEKTRIRAKAKELRRRFRHPQTGDVDAALPAKQGRLKL